MPGASEPWTARPSLRGELGMFGHESWPLDVSTLNAYEAAPGSADGAGYAAVLGGGYVPGTGDVRSSGPAAFRDA